jgi:hypothetical protein
MKEDGPGLTIGNEFTTIEVRKIRTRNGERLEILSRRLGLRIHLDPLELESLTWQDASTFSRLLETPSGPADITESRSLSDLLMPNGDVHH